MTNAQAINAFFVVSLGFQIVLEKTWYSTCLVGGVLSHLRNHSQFVVYHPQKDGNIKTV